MELSERLSALRKEKGLTLRELAEQVGITAAALSNYEKGQKEPSLGYAKKLAQYYGVSLDYLCGGEMRSNGRGHRVFTYGDVIRTLFSLIAYGQEKTAKDTFGATIFLSRGTDWTVEAKFKHPEKLVIQFVLDDTRVTGFLDVYMKIKGLADGGQIPQSVCDDWYNIHIKEMDEIKLGFAVEEPKQTYLTATSRPIMKK